jgi:hypothetical protein
MKAGSGQSYGAVGSNAFAGAGFIRMSAMLGGGARKSHTTPSQESTRRA